MLASCDESRRCLGQVLLLRDLEKLVASFLHHVIESEGSWAMYGCKDIWKSGVMLLASRDKIRRYMGQVSSHLKGKVLASCSIYALN